MTDPRQLSCPVMARSAGFHADQTSGLLLEERQELRAANRPVEGNCSIRGDAVNLTFLA